MKKWVKLMGIGMVSFALTACSLFQGQGESTAPTPNQSTETTTTPTTTQKDTMVLAMDTPKTLHPLYNTQNNVAQALHLIFSPLVNIEEDGTISSNLAESWVVNETQTAVTITLKSGVTWHDGTPLTSDDVLFTLSQIKAIPDCPYQNAVSNILSTEKIDSTTFKIIYKQSFSGVLQALFFPVIPKHIYGVPAEEAQKLNPVGSGPYMYESTTPLEALYLKANPNYFKGQPQILKVKINFIPDEESSLYSFKQGLIDVVYTNEIEWGKYTNNETHEPYEMVSPIYEFMGLNMNKAIFQNKNVRTALVYGIDREEIVNLYYLGHAVVTDSPISPVSYLNDKTLEQKGYDKEAAKLLLTEEGYQLDESSQLMTKGGRTLKFSLLVNKENTERVKVAKEMQRMYKEIGIEMTVETVEQETYLSRITSKQYDAFLGGYQLSYALDLSFILHSASVLKGENYTGYTDSQMDELLQQAFVATPNQVEAAYSKLQQYLETMNPYVSLYFKKSVLLTKNSIKGEIKPTPLNVFANVEKWTLSA